jgi:hypothetical protein
MVLLEQNFPRQQIVGQRKLRHNQGTSPDHLNSPRPRRQQLLQARQIMIIRKITEKQQFR